MYMADFPKLIAISVYRYTSTIFGKQFCEDIYVDIPYKHTSLASNTCSTNVRTYTQQLASQLDWSSIVIPFQLPAAQTFNSSFMRSGLISQVNWGRDFKCADCQIAAMEEDKWGIRKIGSAAMSHVIVEKILLKKESTSTQVYVMSLISSRNKICGDWIYQCI